MFRILRLPLCALFILSPLFVHAEERWVHGSWANVREGEEAQSVVIAHVTTNTRVELVAQHGERCEIVWGEPRQRGFVPCGLLGEKPLTLAETDNPLRRFWIAPSVKRLFEAGEYFHHTLLPKKQWKLEHNEGDHSYHNGDTPPELVRYPVPEFEAMKAMLAKGIVFKAENDELFPTCQQLEQAKARQTDQQVMSWSTWLEQAGCQVAEIPKLRLPEIPPLVFQKYPESVSRKR
jgi:hypothetical protein